jgi:hypothetical protein
MDFYVMEYSLRKQIIDYFDRLLELVELRTGELSAEAASNRDPEASELVLEKRELFIDEIKNIRAYNLDNLGFIDPEDLKCLAESGESDEVSDVIFKRFCFFVSKSEVEIFSTTMQLSHVDASFGYLVVLDRYLNKANLECYWEFLKFMNAKKTLNEKSSFFELRKDVRIPEFYLS